MTGFQNHREAALALLCNHPPRSPKAGQFLGQLAVDPSPLSPAQADWLSKLLSRAGLPPVTSGGAS